MRRSRGRRQVGASVNVVDGVDIVAHTLLLLLVLPVVLLVLPLLLLLLFPYSLHLPPICNDTRPQAREEVLDHPRLLRMLSVESGDPLLVYAFLGPA